MRSFIIITVLSALAACYSAADLSSEELSKGVNIVFDESAPSGRIMSAVDTKDAWQGWTLLSQGTYKVPAIAGEVQSITKVFRPEPDVSIRGLSLSFDGFPARVSYTPLPTNAMNVTLTSFPGEGIHYYISTYRPN